MKGKEYRKAGFKKLLKVLETQEQRYGSDPDWKPFLDERRRHLESMIRFSGFVVSKNATELADARDAYSRWTIAAAIDSVSRIGPMTSKIKAIAPSSPAPASPPGHAGTPPHPRAPRPMTD